MIEDVAIGEALKVEPLDDRDVLAAVNLHATGSRGLDPTSSTAVVRCGRPLLYPVPLDELPPYLQHRAQVGKRVLGLLLAFDLEPDPGGRRYAAANFEVGLDDPGAMAVRIDPDAVAAGIVLGQDEPVAASASAVRVLQATRRHGNRLARLFVRGRRPVTRIAGLQSNRFSWYYADSPDIPSAFGMHALVEVPATATHLCGTIDVQVRFTATSRQPQDAALLKAVPFVEPLPGQTSPAAPAGAAVRLCVAADVVRYSRQPLPISERTQRRFVEVLARARAEAGIAEHDVQPQAQGDGQFTVLPVGIDELDFVPRFVRGLDDRLREINRDLADSARLRLRVALHRGLVKVADNGWVGSSAIAVHRILDSDPLRQAVDASAGSNFALAVPDVLYRDVIAHLDGWLSAAAFQESIAEIPAKAFHEVVWIYTSPTAQ